MIKWYIILLIFAICIPIQFAFAQTEVGQNYDKELLSINPNGTQTIKWSSHYERIYDGNQWVNYKWSQNGNKIHFESALMKYDFDNCVFNISSVKDLQTNATFTHSLLDNGIDVETVCNITSIVAESDGITITTKESNSKSELITTYNTIATGMTEWTYEPKNIEPSTTKVLGIKDTCVNCIFESQGLLTDEIIMNGIIVDTKDRTHNSLKEITIDKNIEFVYESKSLAFDEKVIIDPTASLTVSSLETVGDLGTNNVCDDTGSAGGYGSIGTTSFYVSALSTPQTNDCYREWMNFDTSSIPNTATITDTDLQIHWTTAISVRIIDFYLITSNDVTGGTNAEQFDWIDDDTLVVNDWNNCASVCTEDIDLGATTDTRVKTVLTTNDKLQLGARYSDETIDATEHADIADGTGGTTLKLIVVYLEACNAPTSPTAKTQTTSQIRLGWTAPSTCGSTLTGYKIWSESPTGNGFTVLVANTTNSTTHYDNTGLTSGTQYNYKIAGWSHEGLGENSTTKSNYTIASAPTNLIATTISTTRIDLAWTQSGTASGFKIERESPVGAGWSVLVANTTSSTPSYSNTGLTQNTQYNYRIYAHNNGGTSAVSTNAFNTTFGAIYGNFYINYTEVGDALGITPRMKLTGGNPPPTLVSIVLKNGSNTLQTQTLGYPLLLNNTTLYFDNFYEGSLGNTPSTYKVQFNIQNATSTYTYDSNSTSSIDQLFSPDYLPAIAGGTFYNYTYERSGINLILNVTRNTDSQILNCHYETSDNINDGGDWINVSGTSYFAKTYQTDGAGTNIYTRCFNPNNLVFTLISYGNTTGILVGLAGMESTLGTFFGLPLVFMFILFVASLYSGNRAGMGLLVTMIVTGILSSIGAFIMAENIWGIVLVLASVGLFALRKIL